MSHRDTQGCCVRLNSGCLKLALRWLLEGIDWSQVKFREDCTWTPRLLATTALLWAWSDELTLVERFHSVRRIVLHLCPQVLILAGSYQAFMKMLRRWTDELIALLQTAFRERLRRELYDCWPVLGFVMFAVDGSRGELPRTQSHEQAYSPIRKPGRKKKPKPGQRRRQPSPKKVNSPQLWLTTMWHVGTGLPWDWRIGPADSSERAHLLEMLDTLPAEALVAADAGFVGYHYSRAILDNGRHLLLRVGANITLLKKLGYVRENGNIVYVWPDHAARQDQPPIVLRLVVAHNGKHPVYVVTDILSSARLTDRQVLELYARRWGIELFYRHLKQTFQRRKLRSANAENARVEMNWSYAGLWSLALYALVQAHAKGIPPQRLSIAQSLRAVRRMLRDYLHPTEPGESLRQRLRSACIDLYRRRSKTSRDYPRKRQEKQPGPPHIIQASSRQIQLAKIIRRELSKKG